MFKSKKNTFLFILKVAVSSILIWYLLNNTDLSAIYLSLKTANPWWIFFAFVTLNIGKLLTGYRWQILLQAQEIHIHLRSLVASVYVGQFFNSILPSTVGGDAYRAYDTATESKQTTKSIISLIADRLIGVFALALLAVVALFVGWLIGDDVSFYVFPVLFVFILCSLGMSLVFFDRPYSWFDSLLRRFNLHKFADQLTKAYESLYSLRKQPIVLLAAFIISILLQINVVLFYYFIGVALDMNVSFLYFAMIVPVALVVLLVPFSINGIGIREGIFVFLLTGLGVPSSQAIALSWISFGLMLTQGIIGGVIFALRGEDLRRSHPNSAVSQEQPKQ